MSDGYQALLDCSASPDDARALVPLIAESLSRIGLILPELSPDCVLGGVGYPAGPACADAYTAIDASRLLRANRFWTLRTSGVEIRAEPWVNMLGFTMFDGADCPRCGHRRDDDFLDDVGEAVEDFTTSGVVPQIACPGCKSASSLHEWNCHPHLGFVNLAIIFWNWPPFDAPEWKLNVPAILEEQFKRPLVRTYGHA